MDSPLTDFSVPGDAVETILDVFVRSPISALRFIALSLRRTKSTPRDTRFARLELGLLTKSSQRATFYMFIILNGIAKSIPELKQAANCDITN
jgi:hypothetical protein